MDNLLTKILGKKVVIGDIYNDKFVFTIETNFQYKKKYSNIHILNWDEIYELIKFIDIFDYCIFFKDISSKNNLVKDAIEELMKLNKIIFIDELCKQVLKPPCDYTIEAIIVNLQDTHRYIFGYDYYFEQWDEQYIIFSLLKILKYLKLNLLSDYELFDSILKTNNDEIRIISFNVFNSNPDLKKYETVRQISHLKYINPEIMFLQECSFEIESKFEEYDVIKTESHCGYTCLLIKKTLKPIVHDCICQDGIILSWVTTIYGDFVLGSLHMIPYDDEEDIMFRLEQIAMFQDWIAENNLNNIPIIIGGDTNMIYRESSHIKNQGFFTELSNPSYPNRQIIYKKANIYTRTVKEDFAYDKYFIKNIDASNFQTVNTLDSDHLMNYLSINVK